MICSFDRHPHARPKVNCTHEDRPCSYNGTNCCRTCFDQAKADFNAAWEAHRAETDACPDCQAARAKEFERSQRTETIDPSVIYGQHIPLCCRDHMPTGDLNTDLWWNTKNIAAGRSIFFNGWGRNLSECSCSANRLFSPGRLIHHLILLYGGDTTLTAR